MSDAGSSSARAAIFDGIRRSLRRDHLAKPEREVLARRLAEPRPNLVPARGQGDNLIERFAAMLVETQASLERVATRADAPAALARFLADSQLPPRAVVSPALAGLDWSGWEVRFGAAQKGDVVSVTPAFRGVAETGTLVLTSGPERPSSLNFMPDLHIALLAETDVVGSYEDAWEALRPLGAGTSLRPAGAWPRTVNWITGPSRTADIEQSLLLGAHGPRRLHVVLHGA